MSETSSKLNMVCSIKKFAKVFIIFEVLVVSLVADNGTTFFLPGEIYSQSEASVDAGLQASSLPSLSGTTSGNVEERTTHLDYSTSGTEPLRHNLGRSLPVPHYHLPDSRWGPFFEEGSEPFNITARVGTTVTLDCRIGLLQDKTVTWLHHKDDSIQLLTVGRSAYSRDERITLSFRYPNNFRLEIVYVTLRDEGLYECQVATHPPKVKRLYLKVTAPEITIVDESRREVTERYYKPGSTLELTCIAAQVGSFTDKPPISWRHEGHTLIRGISSNNFNMSTNSGIVVSILTLSPLHKRHSGNYTCSVGALAFNTVAVHVLNGELPAAVHLGNAMPSIRALEAFVLLVTLLLFLCLS